MTTETHRSATHGERPPARRQPIEAPIPRNEEEIIRNSFRTRARQAVEQIAMSASVEALAQALGASTDFGAVAWALGNAGLPASALDLDPLADAFARGVSERERLAGLAGGLLSSTEIGRALGGISRQAIDKRRRAHQMLAVRVAGDWRYPAVQFSAEGQIPRLLPRILETGVDLGMREWAMLDFLLAPDATLHGLSPIEVLKRDGHEAVIVQRLLDAMRYDAFG